MSNSNSNSNPTVSSSITASSINSNGNNSNAEMVQNEKIAAAKQSLPWVEKYRPSSLDELIAHEDIIAICKYCNLRICV